MVAGAYTSWKTGSPPLLARRCRCRSSLPIVAAAARHRCRSSPLPLVAAARAAVSVPSTCRNYMGVALGVRVRACVRIRVSLVFSRGAWWASAVRHLRMASRAGPKHRLVGCSVARGAPWPTAAALPVYPHAWWCNGTSPASSSSAVAVASASRICSGLSHLENTPSAHSDLASRADDDLGSIGGFRRGARVNVIPRLRWSRRWGCRGRRERRGW